MKDNKQILCTLNNMMDLRNRIKQIINEIDNVSNYITNHSESNDISSNNLNNINQTINEFDKYLNINNTIESFLNSMKESIKRRGYNSLSLAEKIQIVIDKSNGYSQNELEDKYFTYQSIISRVIKEFKLK